MEDRPGESKPTKIPYNPVTGEKAKSNDLSTWTNFETCVAAVELGDYDGLGFEFSPPYIGVDLNHCRDTKSGELEQWAQEVVTHLNSYTEVSPSGTGLHILCKGELPAGRRRKGPIEMYAEGRFFTVTGALLPGSPTSIEDRTQELAELDATVFEAPVEPIAAKEPNTTAPVPLDDEEIIRLASEAANGPKFLRLWEGRWRGEYNSQSEGDEALCCSLGFWTGKDSERIDSLFRRSGLFRDKWDRLDYRQRTIAAAITSTRGTYTMPRRTRIERLYKAARQQDPVQETCISTADNSQDDFQYRQTDLGNSERFIRQHGQDLRFCVESNTWHVWDGTRWKADKLRTVDQRAKATVKTMYQLLAQESDDDKRKALFKHIQKSEGERALTAMVNLAKSDLRIAISVEAFDTAPHLLACINGVIDLRTGELQPHRREDLITKQCPVVYDPSATSERWEQFLKDCTQNDAELQAFIKRAVGCTIFGDAPGQFFSC